jgi:predicted DCC family thiol-disulfide oxidoreductase YuxK
MTDGPRSTTPPGRYVVLYDGQCKLCDAGSQRLLRMARRGAIGRVDFQQPGALDPFPGLTHHACMKQMYLVAPDGQLYAGFEAAVQAVATRRGIGWIAYLYYIPGIRQLFDLLYRWIAAHRYRLFRKKVATGECDSAACAVHFQRR